MPKNEFIWPPTRRPFESEEDWLIRLDKEIEEEHCRWLGKIASGDEGTLVEIAEWITADAAIDAFYENRDDSPVDEQVIPELKSSYTIRMSRVDQHKAAVRNGDQDAVDEYAEDILSYLKFNTIHEDQGENL